MNEKNIKITKQKQPVYKYFQTSTGTITNTDKFFSWKSKGFSDEIIKIPATSGQNFAPKLTFIFIGKIEVKVEGNCSK